MCVVVVPHTVYCNLQLTAIRYCTIVFWVLTQQPSKQTCDIDVPYVLPGSACCELPLLQAKVLSGIYGVSITLSGILSQINNQITALFLVCIIVIITCIHVCVCR